MKTKLLNHTMMTPVERRMGRFLRAPDGHPGGGAAPAASPAPTENNGAGNAGDSGGTGGGGENNAGQGFDYAGFWNEPSAEGGANRDSSGGGNGGQSNQQQPGGNGGNQSYGERLNAEIGGMRFDEVFTRDVADQIADGNLEGANAGIQALGQQVLRQSVIMNAKLMQTFGNNIMEMMRGEIQAALGNRDNNESLLEAFPSAKDPAIRPMINGVFQQAMKHSGGDRSKAIALTRDMLKFMGNKAAGDFGLETPPGGREDFLGDGPSALVEELLGRS